ncbi:PilZ domain-containing protein [Sphingomicrobium nitratireducens]|uniref:PilZ domain-containing protein n=1 Tax=Sphingomicrobium nitratireducens TaxID=2964666 RepID=UPI00223F513F|nr:PilZ domain-containing protein [Sphingomicrobium nitratireducens]
MTNKSLLDGGMIPRTVKRVFDQRIEVREETQSQTAVLTIRGKSHVVRLCNISPSGAMVAYRGVPHIGEQITLQLLDHGEQVAYVRWVRDGRIGVNFAAPLSE